MAFSDSVNSFFETLSFFKGFSFNIKEILRIPLSPSFKIIFSNFLMVLITFFDRG